MQYSSQYLAHGDVSKTLEVINPEADTDRIFIIIRGFCLLMLTPDAKPACTKREPRSSHRKYLSRSYNGMHRYI